MVHTKANFDGMGLADWVFPGFLFMVGMSIPFAIRGRINKGQSKLKALGYILVRTISLLIIGVLMLNSDRLNSDRLNSDLSGINGQLWAILMYVSVFLVWNLYSDNPRFKNLYLGLKILGIVGLMILAAIFKSGTVENTTWLETGWWGILGLIGWGYLAAAVTYLFVGEKLWKTVVVWLFFVGLNILSQIGLTGFLNPIKPVFGVLIGGNTPSIVLAGLVVCLIFQKLNALRFKNTIVILLALGIGALLAGFILRNWFIISKIKGTPSWAMVCNGISLLLFALIYWITDVLNKTKWAALFLSAGQNSLTTYLAPDIVYYLIWGLSLPFFFYKQGHNQLLAVAGSLIWAVLMVLFTALLSKLKIKLRL